MATTVDYEGIDYDYLRQLLDQLIAEYDDYVESGNYGDNEGYYYYLSGYFGDYSPEMSPPPPPLDWSDFNAGDDLSTPDFGDMFESMKMMSGLGNDTKPDPDVNSLYRTSRWVKFAFMLPASVILSVFGAITNIINLTVFRRLGFLVDSCTPILVGLAMSDFVYCLISFITCMLQLPGAFAFYGGKDDEHNSQTMDAVVARIDTSLCVFVQFTCWATTFLAFERMISIIFPFQIKAFFTPRRSAFIIAMIFVASFFLNLHQMIFFKLVWKSEMMMEGKSRQLYAVETGLVSSNVYNKLDLVNHIILRLASIVLVFILNTVVILQITCRNRRIRKSKKVGGGSGGGEKRFEIPTSRKETKLTRLMSAVCILFLVCYPLGVIYNIAMTFDTVTPYNRSVYELILSNIFPVLELANASLNFVIYKTFSSKFATELRRLRSSREN